MERFEVLKSKAIKLKTQIEQHYTTALDLKAQYDEVTVKLQSEKDSLSTQNFAIDALKEIMDKMSQEHIEKIVDLLTYALRTIFYDKEYSIESSISDKRGVKNLDFILVENKEDEIVRSNLADGVGGGILAVVGIVLQIYYINAFRMSPILLLDEQLSQVSSDYIEPLMNFLKEVSDKKDLIIVMIAHDPRLMRYANKRYEVFEGVAKEVKINGPERNNERQN